jgi:hypothetical protein
LMTMTILMAARGRLASSPPVSPASICSTRARWASAPLSTRSVVETQGALGLKQQDVIPLSTPTSKIQATMSIYSHLIIDFLLCTYIVRITRVWSGKEDIRNLLSVINWRENPIQKISNNAHKRKSIEMTDPRSSGADESAKVKARQRSSRAQTSFSGCTTIRRARLWSKLFNTLQYNSVQFYYYFITNKIQE